MDISPLHPPNALFPILVTELGIVKCVKLTHALKEQLPILVTEFGIFTKARLLHPAKA
jgi:hypothetical protein